MKSILFPSEQRGSKDIGWLKSKFTFSFSDYYNPQASAFGTLLAFNDDLLEVGKGFGTHPHQNMEIISIMLRGKMNHKDSMGHSTTIEAGGVQIMSAGSGLHHEEYNIGEEEVHFLQIWIQPKLQNISPRYQQRFIKPERRLNNLCTVVSHEEGLGHCWINQNTTIQWGHSDKPTSFDYKITSANKCVFVFCVQGQLRLGNNKLQSRDALGIWDIGEFELMLEENTEIILIETVVNQK